MIDIAGALNCAYRSDCSRPPRIAPLLRSVKNEVYWSHRSEEGA